MAKERNWRRRREGENAYIDMCWVLIVGTGFEMKLWDAVEASMMDREGDIKEPLSRKV